MLSAEALRRYFKTLSQIGYKGYDSVHKLLILLYIQEIFTGVMSLYITEEDYRVMQRVLNCLYGTTCLIPYPEYANGTSISEIPVANLNTFRITQDGNLRITEQNSLRIVNK